MIQRAAMVVSERDGNSGEMSEGSEDARRQWRWRTAKRSTFLALPQRIVRNRREQKGAWRMRCKLFEPKNHVLLPFKTCRGKLCIIIIIIIIIMVDLQCLRQLSQQRNMPTCLGLLASSCLMRILSYRLTQLALCDV